MNILLKDIVAVTGAPGLYQVVKTDDKALVVESLDGKRKRQMIRGNMMVSKLTDVSIYTKEDSEPLLTILKNIQAKYGSELPVTKKSSNDQLMEFLESVLPDLDSERVYPSNVKKLVSWYKILVENNVEFKMDEEEPEAEPDQKEPEVEAPESEDPQSWQRPNKAEISKINLENKKLNHTQTF